VNAYILGIQQHLPERLQTNEELAAVNPGWNVAKIAATTGIRGRRIAGDNETASDLACIAAQKLLDELSFDRGKIDALLFCSQSPDYFLPTTACLLQERLALSTRCAAFDVNLGCSGFTYSLWLARALVLSQSATNVLILAADTLSKYCDPHDVGTATIFADGAGAALLSSDAKGAIASVGESVLGTDGRGGGNLIVRAGASRARADNRPENQDPYLRMNGPEIFSFTLSVIQANIQALLDKIGLQWNEVDRYFFHQANRFILESLCENMNIPPEKAPIDMEDYGNTASASLPILLRRSWERGLLRANQRCVLAGYGVGYSWAATEVTWLRNFSA
jgi:3-oxoacyl-[acyl-carrier-protein] synthase III